MNVNLYLLLPLLFLAAFVDAVSGGGGVISIPSYLITGFPIINALAINKFSMAISTGVAIRNFYKKGEVEERLIKKLIPFSFIGSIIGSIIVVNLNPNFLKPFAIIILIVIGIYSLFKKDMGLVDRREEIGEKAFLKMSIISLIIGFYDGFFGPGTGSFLIFAFIKIYGFDYLRASANAKILNLTSNLAALVTFIVSGKVIFSYAIIITLVMVIGAYIGSKFALKRGASIVKPFFVTMAILASAKMLIEYFI